MGNVPELNSEQRSIFMTGLLKAVRTTGAWVVTGGTSSGVMRLVGKCMANQEPTEREVCLGVATWGVVRNHEDMAPKRGMVYAYDEGPASIPAGKGPRAPL